MAGRPDVDDVPRTLPENPARLFPPPGRGRMSRPGPGIRATLRRSTEGSGMTGRVRLRAVFAVVVLATSVGIAQQGARGGECRWHSGDLGSTKYSPLDQITRENVSRLRIVWRR